MKLIRLLFIPFLLIVFLGGCKKQDDFNLSSIQLYYPLSPGRVLIYDMDSIIPAPFGSSLFEKSYHAKDSIADTFLDNTNRLSFTVYRFVTDTLESQPWAYRSTYYVTPTSESIELVDDNNLRYIKLRSPVREGYSWKGNTFIDTRSASTAFQYLDGWEYIYQQVNQPFAVASGTIDSTITITQVDETFPEGPFDPQFYQQKNYSVEVYAMGVGLIYKEFLHWTWQTTPPPARYEDNSYGIKLNLIKVQ